MRCPNTSYRHARLRRDSSRPHRGSLGRARDRARYPRIARLGERDAHALPTQFYGDVVARHAYGVNAQPHAACGQAFTRCEFVGEPTVRTDDRAIGYERKIERQTEMRARVLHDLNGLTGACEDHRFVVDRRVTHAIRRKICECPGRHPIGPFRG